MKKALVIGFDTSLEVIDLGDTVEESSDALSNAVDGWYQAVDINETLTMWMNEEGKIDGLPFNAIATKLFQARFGMVDIIMGNAVLTGGADDEGDTIGLTDEQVQQFKFMFS
jgi:hypothetical protein